MWMNRRRFIGIAAAGSAAGLASLARFPTASAGTVWQGIALGAPAKIVTDGEPALAHLLVSAVLAEIERLEMLFSLNRSDSAICVLNRTGRLDRPDPDFLALLSISNRINAASGGAFDPTIQPLWTRSAQEQFGISPVAQARPVTDWDAVRFSSAQVSFARPGMAMTLNGIAQGYITDRVAGILAEGGLNHVLVDMGEIRALGPGKVWPIRLAGPKYRLLKNTVRLRGGLALAVSHSKGTTFDEQGRYGHIIDPFAGTPLEDDRLICVQAPSAVVADGLSTALCAADAQMATTIIDQFPDARLVVCSTSPKMNGDPV